MNLMCSGIHLPHCSYQNGTQHTALHCSAWDCRRGGEVELGREANTLLQSAQGPRCDFTSWYFVKIICAANAILSRTDLSRRDLKLFSQFKSFVRRTMCSHNHRCLN